MPLYVNSLINCDALSGGPDIGVDDRTFNMFAVQTMSVGATLTYLYPRLVPLLDCNEDQPLTATIRCTGQKLREDGVYVLDNGLHIFLWIGLAVSPNWLQGVVGVNSTTQLNLVPTQLPINLATITTHSQLVSLFYYSFS